MNLLIKFIKFMMSLFNKKSSSSEKEEEDTLINEDEIKLENIKIIPLEDEEIEMTLVSKNNSKAEEYYKQTNNEIDPFISCFPTSMINAGATIGVEFPKNDSKTHGYVQPEDQYNWYLETNETCKKFWSKPEFASYLKNPENHPRELWEVEEYCFNKWVGADICKYVPNITVQRIVDLLNRGGSVVTSGKFCGFSHVIAIVGFKANAIDKNNIKEDEVTHFIVDDSYGNPFNNYKPVGVGGNDLEWEKDKLLAAINKGKGDKASYNAILFGEA